MLDDLEQRGRVERSCGETDVLEQALMDLDPGRLGGCRDLRCRLHAFRLETHPARGLHELSARTADINQADRSRPAGEQHGDRPESPARNRKAAFEFPPCGLVEIRTVELRHGFPVARGAGLAHKLAAVGAAQ